MLTIDANYAKSTNGILLLFTIVSSAVCIGLLGDGTAVSVKSGYGLFLLIACCVSLVLSAGVYAAMLLQKIDSRLVLGGLFLTGLLNVSAFIVGGIYNRRFEKIQVAITAMELSSAAMIILILITLGLVKR